MNLALGTVQFGLIYGVAGGREPIPADEIRKILELACKRGITVLDTAPSYGDIESRLGQLCAGLEFQINSKIPPIPSELGPIAAAQWVLESARTSHLRLDGKLSGLLFHRAEDLAGERGVVMWKAIQGWAQGENVAMGVSGYDASFVRLLCEELEISIVQLPGNAFDQRHCAVMASLRPKPQLQLRSAFLQGLLLLPVNVAKDRVPAAESALEQWHRWLGDHALTPLQGALSILKGFEHADTCVIGVDSADQLDELVDAWEDCSPLTAAALARTDSQVIDPRQWKDWRQ
jgi:aryl-alcohol dehydrogenase-like predicted oxidoreductase